MNVALSSAEQELPEGGGELGGVTACSSSSEGSGGGGGAGGGVLLALCGGGVRALRRRRGEATVHPRGLVHGVSRVMASDGHGRAVGGAATRYTLIIFFG